MCNDYHLSITVHFFLNFKSYMYMYDDMMSFVSLIDRIQYRGYLLT